MRCWLLFLFWLVAAGGACVVQSAGEAYGDVRERVDCLTGDEPEALAAFLHANRVADVSLQQSSSVSVSSLLRRCPQFRAHGERFFVFSATDARRMASGYRAACDDAGNYHALQKLSGYYLYQLCRLII